MIAEKILSKQQTEKQLILREYRSLLGALKNKLVDTPTKKRFRNAFKTAADAHKEMRRKSGEPYILHPVAVAKIAVTEMGLGIRSTIAALLHDVVEDTDVCIEDIERKFGKEIALIVQGLTKIDKVMEADVSNQAENFKRILLSIADDPRIIFIKLADRLHNMRTLGQMERTKQLKISAETLYVYAPLAHRLGFNLIKTEMEDLSFKHSEPEAYREIQEKLTESKMKRVRFIANFVRPIREALKQEKIHVKISGRTKSVYSIWNKIKQKGVTFEQVYDLFAIRIILQDSGLSTEEEAAACWKVYSAVANLYRPIQERMRDWITRPKNNGYTALHTTVVTPKARPVEVQIRSHQMNRIAEQGMAAHWKYKSGSKKEGLFDKWVGHIRQSLARIALEPDSVDFLINFKNNFLSDELYVFTHKGDIRILPTGSTVLDFAYTIHSDIGNQCFAAKVNTRLVPIHQTLTSGDQIEIITSKKQTPKVDWLRLCITNKAKSRIKDALNVKKRTLAKEGELLLKRKLKSWDVKYTEKIKHQLQSHYRLASVLDLHYHVQTETIPLADIKVLLTKPDQQPTKVKHAQKNAPLLSASDALRSQKVIEVFDNKATNILTSIAGCCNPVPGDEIFGFLSRNTQDGIHIHKVSCPNATYLFSNHADRIVQTKWAGRLTHRFTTKIYFSGMDKIGLVKEVTQFISNSKVNILSINVSEKKGGFDGQIKLSVEDKKQLNDIIAFLQKHPNIDNIKRQD